LTNELPTIEEIYSEARKSKFFNDPRNPYTIVVSRGKSSFTGLRLALLEIHSRKRFLEMVVVNDLIECVKLVKELPKTTGYAGVDKVQTVALWVYEGEQAIM